MPRVYYEDSHNSIRKDKKIPLLFTHTNRRFESRRDFLAFAGSQSRKMTTQNIKTCISHRETALFSFKNGYCNVMFTYIELKSNV